MINFLFWNIKRKPLATVVSSLVLNHEVDILILAECDIDSSVLLGAINRHNRNEFFLLAGLCSKIKIFSRFIEKFVTVLFEANRWTIRRLSLPAREEILLAATHQPSKLHANSIDQFVNIGSFMSAIRQMEKESGHAKTVVVGDFNANPFESGMVGTAGLHAVMSRQIAQGLKRTVENEEYDFFYNPMWGLMGDTSPGPPGTYYYGSPRHEAFYWHTFDQVLIRPGLLDRFDHRDIKVLTVCGDISLLSAQGVPNKRDFSDHLPLFFRLSL